MRSRLSDAIALLLALLHAVMALTAAATKSPTFDEPTHFAAGYSFWLRRDFRLDPEAGNLPSRWAALPLLFTKPKFVPAHAETWKQARQGEVATQFLYDVGNDADALLFQGRAMMAFVSAALCLLIYAWSKALFGTSGALISVALAAFSPNLLAHGPLVTGDTAAAFFFTAAVWSFWRALHKSSIPRVCVCTASVAGVFLTKMSAVVVLPMMIVMLAVCIWRGGAAQRLRQVVGSAAMLAMIGGVTLFAIWAAFCFRYSAFSDATAAGLWEQHWPILLHDGGVVGSAVAFAREHRLLPEAYLYGFLYARNTAQVRPAFLDGNWSVIGFADFFPRAFLYKTPLCLIGLLLLSAAAAVMWARQPAGRQNANRMRLFYESTPLWGLVIIYAAFAVSAALNIGHRHLLPIYPPLFVICGACAFFFKRALRLPAVAIAALLSGHVAVSLSVRPNYLAYFNLIAGGPRNGYRHLVDSSLDWGQDLPALRRWLDKNRPAERPVYLAYFGTARPAYYGIDAVTLPAEIAQLRGRTYCISATTLQQVYSRAMGPWCEPYERHYQQLRASPTSDLPELAFARLCAFLRHRGANESAGHSILIFRLSDEEVRQALEGAPAELFPTPQVLGLE